jgi:hypothetical protein
MDYEEKIGQCAKELRRQATMERLRTLRRPTPRLIYQSETLLA